MCRTYHITEKKVLLKMACKELQLSPWIVAFFSPNHTSCEGVTVATTGARSMSDNNFDKNVSPQLGKAAQLGLPEMKKQSLPSNLFFTSKCEKDQAAKCNKLPGSL